MKNLTKKAFGKTVIVPLYPPVAASNNLSRRKINIGIIDLVEF